MSAGSPRNGWLERRSWSGCRARVRGWNLNRHLGLGFALSNRRCCHRVAEDNDIHAAVHAATFRGEIGRDGVIFGVSSGAHTIRSETVTHDEEPNNFG